MPILGLRDIIVANLACIDRSQIREALHANFCSNARRQPPPQAPRVDDVDPGVTDDEYDHTADFL